MEMKFPIHQNQLFRLDAEEIDNPVRMINSFFNSYSLPKCRDLLWQIQIIAFGGNAAGTWDGDEIGEWVFFHRSLEELIEAAFIIRTKNGFDG